MNCFVLLSLSTLYLLLGSELFAIFGASFKKEGAKTQPPICLENHYIFKKTFWVYTKISDKL